VAPGSGGWRGVQFSHAMVDPEDTEAGSEYKGGLQDARQATSLDGSAERETNDREADIQVRETRVGQL